jgi:hypothetical protein
MFVPWAGDTPGAVCASPYPDPAVIAGTAVVRTVPEETGVQAPERQLALLTSAGSGQVALWRERGGKFEPNPAETPLALPAPALGFVCADFNRDGLDDLAVAFRDGLRLYFRQAGSFRPAFVFSELGALTASLTAGDFNSDGRPDLLVVDETGRGLFLISKGPSRELLRDLETPSSLTVQRPAAEPAGGGAAVKKEAGKP